jgi:hypothetical protein
MSDCPQAAPGRVVLAWRCGLTKAASYEKPPHQIVSFLEFQIAFISYDLIVRVLSITRHTSASERERHHAVSMGASPKGGTVIR